MVKRLTEYFENGAYTEKQNIIDISDKVKFFDNGCVMGKAIDKLAQLEDIMEKYGIESVEELDKKIGYYIDKIDLEAENDYLKKTIEKQNVVTQSISKDRDTWKRACELACETLKQVMGKPLWIGGNIPAPEVKDTEYFYQQAKKEGEHGN